MDTVLILNWDFFNDNVAYLKNSLERVVWLYISIGSSLRIIFSKVSSYFIFMVGIAKTE